MLPGKEKNKPGPASPDLPVFAKTNKQCGFLPEQQRTHPATARAVTLTGPMKV
jgi:hypothetical protein